MDQPSEGVNPTNVDGVFIAVGVRIAARVKRLPPYVVRKFQDLTRGVGPRFRRFAVPGIAFDLVNGIDVDGEVTSVRSDRLVTDSAVPSDPVTMDFGLRGLRLRHEPIVPPAEQAGWVLNPMLDAADPVTRRCGCHDVALRSIVGTASQGASYGDSFLHVRGALKIINSANYCVVHPRHRT
jgi:hypothetical protein